MSASLSTRVRPALGLLLVIGLVGDLRAQRADSTAALLGRLEQHGGRVIVGLRPTGARKGMRQPGVRGLSVADAARIASDLRSVGFVADRHFRIITAASGTIAPHQLRALRSHPNVEYVEPDFVSRLDDLAVASVLEETPYGIEKIRAPEAWAATNPSGLGAGVKVGIMDTGGDPLHEDLHYAGGYDAVTNSTADSAWADRLPTCGGHGTHVGGTVGAIRANDLGVVGVAPEVSLYALKVFEEIDDGYGVRCGAYHSTVLIAFDWAMGNGIQVINMSFGHGGYLQSEHQALQAAVAHGIVLVGSAGNGNGPVGYPAANPEVIAVAATDEFDQRAWFSSFGPEVDVAAPGVNVLSTLPGNQYDFYSGTSMSAPHVTALAALLRSLQPALTVAQVRAYITGWAVDLGSPGIDDLFGFGRVDALASVTALTGPTPPTLSIVQQPGAGLSGRPLTQQPAVRLVDANNQPISQGGVAVSAIIGSGTGRITAAALRTTSASAPKGESSARLLVATTITDTSGTARFTDLTITGTGFHTLRFSSPGHIAVTSDSFNVTLPPPTPLINGVPVSGISGALGTMQYWVLTAPSSTDALSVTTDFGSGDVDLYVRRGAVPDLFTWDCRSWSSVTTESCSFSGNVAGDWYVLLYGYTDYAGVTLVGRVQSAARALSLTRPAGDAPAWELLHPQPVVELRGAQGQPVHQAGVTVTVTANRAGILIDSTPPQMVAVTDSQGRATFDGLVITDHGTHVLTFSTPGLNAATQSIIIAQPLPVLDSVAVDLVSGHLTPAQRAYLDAVGNGDGVFNLGDVLAYVDRLVPARARRRP